MHSNPVYRQDCHVRIQVHLSRELHVPRNLCQPWLIMHIGTVRTSSLLLNCLANSCYEPPERGSCGNPSSLWLPQCRHGRHPEERDGLLWSSAANEILRC